ncbi:uroporphyrinogen-III synthase, partial [uncultured Anaerotruncus sp.]|uniref:uroporphyrinogen-III synthase n=1 Tax=uncultured Anaerotruncus sp. TaxID=905011 RepID=UPI00280B2C00
GRAAGERVLICRAREGSPDLTRALDAAGISYDDLPLYETRCAHPDAERAAELLDAGEIDYVAFTSASTVRGFVETLGKRDYQRVCAVCIGESTAAAAREYGMRVEIAAEPSLDAMARRMTELSEKERN